MDSKQQTEALREGLRYLMLTYGFIQPLEKGKFYKFEVRLMINDDDSLNLYGPITSEVTNDA